jgi:hypothetical protein
LTLQQTIERRVGLERHDAASTRSLTVWRLAAQHALFAVVPVLFTIWMCAYSISRHSFALDFNHSYWPAAHQVLDGVSPYARSQVDVRAWIGFPYPAFTAIALVPFALLHHGLANWVFTFINIAAALLTLRVLNVRDWRLYGLVLILWPVVIGWQSANLTLLLGLGTACLWRKRNNPLVAGALVAVMISLKPFVWPLGLWLLATRRYRALIYGAGVGLAINAASWAIVGFNQIHVYSDLVSSVSSGMDKRAYSILSLVLGLGGSHGLAYALWATAAAAGAIACLVVGLRGNTRSALALSIAVCLLATPIVWTHYFALLIVPLAIFRPRLDALWLLPLALWVCPGNAPGLQPQAWQIAAAVATSALVIGLLLRGPHPEDSSDREATASAVPELAAVA